MRLVIAEPDSFVWITIFDFLLCFADHNHYFLSDMGQSEELNLAKAFPHFRNTARRDRRRRRNQWEGSEETKRRGKGLTKR
jgi:hypothetical protein